MLLVSGQIDGNLLVLTGRLDGSPFLTPLRSDPRSDAWFADLPDQPRVEPGFAEAPSGPG